MIKKLPLIVVLLFLVTSLSWSQDRSPDVDRFLLSQVKNEQLLPSDIANYIITAGHESSTSGVMHTYFRQSYQGIEIIGAEGSVHTKDGKMIQGHHSFFSKISERVTVSNHSLPELQAINKIAQELGGSISGVRPQSIYKNQKPNTRVYTGGNLSQEDIPVKKIYKQLLFGKVIAAYEISVRETNSVNWYNFYVDATTGDILAKNNWTSTCGFDHTHDEDEDKPLYSARSSSHQKTAIAAPAMIEGTYNVYAQPLTSPHAGDRTIVSDVFNTTASPFGWHDTDGINGPEFTTTRGNNVNAYEDGDNIGYQPDGGSDLIFDYPVNTVFSFGDQSEDAAITNLFYWNNFIHDVLYLYGLDEASGNFQENNYGNGGLGNDSVNAEAQDGSGSCNANFQSPPDGFSGTMQMYTCGSRDGDLDNHVIIHEYGHGISTRLTGGGNNSDCLFNDEQMGEGWSDWYGNVLTMKVGDVGTDLRPVGNWLFEQDADGPGIRDYPYTTDLSQDPRTYDSIKNTGGPHPLGSVWAAMLWEMTWGLIDEHGFDPDVYNGEGGNNIAIALVTEGLKLQPCNPGFVDGRDAILAADVALYDGINQCIIWEAFAKRGLGQSAVQGSSFDRNDGTEAFDSPATTLTTPDEPYCVTDSDIIIAGGLPTGGVYSGPGVSDNGDGITYTFSPASAGVGTHVISYSVDSDCTDGGTATSEIFVKDENPIIECQNITVSLDINGNATIVPEDIVTNFLSGEGYTLDQDGEYSPVEGLTGTSVTLFDDSVSPNLPIGFDFTFYNETYSTFNISSNGFITFESTGNSGCCSGDIIPDTSGPNNFIAFAWSDLFPGGSSSVRYSTIGLEPNRTLIVDFDEVSFCCSDDPKVTTQIKLFEGTNRIEIHSESVEGFGMTQGIENADGTEGIPVPGRNSQNFTISSDYVAFVPNTGNFPDNCGNTTTVALDITAFTCDNIGENTVIATATDSEGNSSTCTSIVTVVSNQQVLFDEIEESFCADQDPITGLSGGTPTGGIYSGTGVTDDGNGETFTFDPSISGEGSQTITYSGQNSCDEEGQASITVEIQAAIPEIECLDITVTLDENGQATIVGEQLVVGGDGVGSLYAINPFSSTNNIALYDYNTSDDELVINPEGERSTNIARNFSMDENPATGQVYLLAGPSSADRNLYAINLEDDSDVEFISDIQSVNGSTNAQDMSFGLDGKLYFVFNSGEVNIYDISTDTMEPFSTVSSSGATGVTFDYDGNRLIYATDNFPVNLRAIDLNSGDVTDLFSYSTDEANSCSGQAIEYVGNNKLIVSATGGCNSLYTVDLNTQEITLLQSPSGSFSSIKDLLFIDQGVFDNCNGDPLVLTVSPSTFDCTNAGENTVTVTATDSNGNTTECTSTVTIITDFEVTLQPNQLIFCTDQETSTDLGGGLPTGGIYSGSGVTDNGDGLTFTFNPAIAGEGMIDITYTVSDLCGQEGNATVTVDVQPPLPEIVCQEVTLALDENGQATLSPENVAFAASAGNSEGELYVLNPFDSDFSIARYTYNPQSDEITYDPSYSKSTGQNLNNSLDFNASDGLVYLLSTSGIGETRSLFTLDLSNPSDDVTLISTIVSSTGNTSPQAMEFGNDGTLYFVFQGGDIEAYDLNTQTYTPVANVPQDGSVGMAYDRSANRLILTSGAGTTFMHEVLLNTGEVNELFSFNPPNGCSAQGLEYVGDGKLIAGSTFSCDNIYTINLETEEVELLLNPTGSFNNIKDFIFFGNSLVDNCNGEDLNISLSQSIFTCDDIGTTEVTVTVSDNNGNSSTCTSQVTIIDDLAPVLECTSNPTVTLDASGNGTLTIDDIVSTAVLDNCGEVEISISKTEFSCEDFNNVSLANIISNGSFENGLESWTSQTLNGESSNNDGACNRPWLVGEDSSNVCCCVTDIFPTDQNFAVFTSFDGPAGISYELSQTVVLPTINNPEEFSAVLSFDWAANYDNSGLDREFTVEILDQNGTTITTAYTELLSSFGELSVSPEINVSSDLQPYTGQEITLVFRAFIPEGFTGPSKSMIDNVALVTGSNATQVIVTATDNSGNTSECIVEVLLLDPNDACNLSIEEALPSTSISLYPNPASSSFIVNWNNDLEIKNLEMFDLAGKKVRSLQPAALDKTVVIETQSLSSGVYLLKVRSANDQTLVKRVIIQ